MNCYIDFIHIAFVMITVWTLVSIDRVDGILKFVIKKSKKFVPPTNTKRETKSAIECSVYCSELEMCHAASYDANTTECWISSKSMNEARTYLKDSSIVLLKSQHCPADYGYDKFTDICYKVYNISVNWYEARTTCKKDSGDLVVITTKEKWDLIFGLGEEEGRNLWIGLKNKKWLNGQTYVNIPETWAILNNYDRGFDGKPGPFCGAFAYSDPLKNIHDFNCKFRKIAKFICEIMMI